jgi:hypothetical protein
MGRLILNVLLSFAQFELSWRRKESIRVVAICVRPHAQSLSHSSCRTPSRVVNFPAVSHDWRRTCFGEVGRQLAQIDLDDLAGLEALALPLALPFLFGLVAIGKTGPGQSAANQGVLGRRRMER